MAGYSGTPLARKLGIREGHRVVLVNAPHGFETSLAPIPHDCTISRRAAGKSTYDVIVLFVQSRAELQRRFEALLPRLEETGGLWVAWPKKASKVETDLSFAVVQPHGLAAGLVDNKICAVDDVYSGLRFVVRVENRTQSKTKRSGR